MPGFKPATFEPGNTRPFSAFCLGSLDAGEGLSTPQHAFAPDSSYEIRESLSIITSSKNALPRNDSAPGIPETYGLLSCTHQPSVGATQPARTTRCKDGQATTIAATKRFRAKSCTRTQHVHRNPCAQTNSTDHGAQAGT